jgi:hypothetical protein
MATLASTQPTLLDHAKRIDPDGKVPIVAELLSQTNEILTDAVFVQGNLPTGHRVVVRTGLPTVYWRTLNAGVPTSKSTTAQVDEGCGMMEARSHVDQKLAALSDDIAGFRLSEDKAFIEAMNQLQATTMFYGNPATDPRQYLGLSARYGAISGAGNATNIIDAGGVSSNNTSIWLIVWSDQTVFCTFPKNSKAGLSHKDLGEESVQDSNGGWYQALRTLYQWDNGLVVKDWRYAVRICNINTTNLVTESSAADVLKLMIKAIARIPSIKMGRPVFYMNRTVKEMLEIQTLGKNTSGSGVINNVILDDLGKLSQVMSTFRGIPIRQVDTLLNTEARVV